MKDLLSEISGLLFRVAILLILINVIVLLMLNETITMRALFSPLFMKEKMQFLVSSIIIWVRSWT
jgi:hypothetical protein